MNEILARQQAPLDELMLAMDVVDTLRHQELMLTRELEADDRDRRLLERLREIYAGQGIAVTDDVLAQGVKALREDRFVFPGPEPGLERTLATLYVSRARWGRWAAAGAVLVVVTALAFQLLIRGPEQRAIASLPAELQSAYQTIVATSADESALTDARGLVVTGEAAVARRELDAARAALAELRDLNARLEQQYEIRVVSRPGELSGVWRVPDDNPNAQNFYLIVEAVAPAGAALTLPIVSEEDGRIRQVSRWGLRVDEATFQRIAADKADDGIIQENVVGLKRRGALDPEYSVPATGAAITQW